MSVAWLGLGSNVGNRAENLRFALRLLPPLVQVEAVSSLYQSDPVGPPDQPPYYNAACRAITGLAPDALLRRLKDVEWEIGRRPGERWGPRPIDLDILLFDSLVVETPDLVIPHPRLVERAFVLLPLAEVAADVHLPASGATVAAGAAAIDASGTRVVAGPEWREPGWRDQPRRRVPGY